MALSETKRAFLAQKYFGQNLPEESGGPEEPEGAWTGLGGLAGAFNALGSFIGSLAEEPPSPLGLGLPEAQRQAFQLPVGGAPGDQWVTMTEESQYLRDLQTLQERGLITPEEAAYAIRVHLGLAPKATAPRAAAPVVFSPRELGLVTPSDLLALLLAERQREEEARQDLVDTLLGLAPRLAAGQNFYGGFGPYGGATLLELLQGGPGAPRPIAVQPVPILTPEDIAARRAENEELIRAAAGAADLSFAGG